MRQLRLPLCLALLLAAPGCDPHKQKITEKNQGTFAEELRASNRLTPEEKALLAEYAVRARAGGAAPLGKTVEQIIREQRRHREQQQAGEEAKRRREAEARARQTTAAQQLKGAVGFRVTDKGFLAKDLAAKRYDDVMFVSVEYENQSGKELRSFAGTLYFKDENGNTLLSGKVRVSEPLAAGAKGTWKAEKSFDQFNDDDTRLKETNMSKVRMAWLPRGMVFADGTVLGETP